MESFISVLKGSKSDAAILLTTFLLTIFIDLTVAIEIGMVLAAFLFMRQMMQTSSVQQTALSSEDLSDEIPLVYSLPKDTDVFEINGPLFFGAAYKFKDTMKLVENPARILIIRMGNVPVIDATGIRVLKEVNKDLVKTGSKLILSEISSDQVMAELKKARLLFQIGKGNIKDTFEQALKRANDILLQGPHQPVL